MDVIWDESLKSRWDALAAEGAAALQQDWAYGVAMAACGARVVRAEARAPSGDPLALAQFLVRDFGAPIARFARLAVCLRGPVWLGAPSEDAKAAVYSALRRTAPFRRPRFMLFSPDEEGRPESLRLARLRRVMTGFSTVLVDLRDDLAVLQRRMVGKWRNRLRAAERAGFQIAAGGVKPAQSSWLLEREDAQRLEKRYVALPTAFVPAYQAASGRRGSVRVIRADLNREKAAAMLFLTHGARATYHIGWASAAGRRASAHNLLLWRAMAQLKADGVEALDLGGVNTETGVGVARFKLGVGGRCVTLCGAYL